MATTATITALFPNESDANYNINYYATQHMPMIAEKWAKYGVTGFSVLKFGPNTDGSTPLYAFGSTVSWSRTEGIQEAFAGPDVGEIMGDVPNFSNKQPVFLIGSVVAST